MKHSIPQRANASTCQSSGASLAEAQQRAADSGVFKRPPPVDATVALIDSTINQHRREIERRRHLVEALEAERALLTRSER